MTRLFATGLSPRLKLISFSSFNQWSLLYSIWMVQEACFRMLIPCAPSFLGGSTTYRASSRKTKDKPGKHRAPNSTQPLTPLAPGTLPTFGRYHRRRRTASYRHRLRNTGIHLEQVRRAYAPPTTPDRAGVHIIPDAPRGRLASLAALS